MTKWQEVADLQSNIDATFNSAVVLIINGTSSFHQH